MLKIHRFFLVLLILFLIDHSRSFGQIHISPYTVNGLGDVNTLALATNTGMGGIGISNGQSWYLNNLNPALLTKNSFTVLEAGMIYESRSLRDNTGLSNSNSGGGINYFAMSFPIVAGKWSSSIGIMPYSTVNYNILSEGNVIGNEDVPVMFNYKGDGGLTQAYFSNGVKLFNNLSLGFKATLFFGSIVNETIGNPGDSTVFVTYQSRAVDQNTINGFQFSTGLTYSIKLNDKTFINTGFTYDFGSNLNAKQYKTVELKTAGSFDPIASDTLVNELAGEVQMPSSYAFGISFEKLYKLTLGVDFHKFNWSEYQNFENTNETLVDNYMINVGAEYIPDATSVDNYLKRVIYRVGFDYQKTPFEVQNRQLNDFGINFGASLPVKGLSSINLSFKFGKRGTTDDDLIEENYFRIHFGISFNDRWFQRRVLN